MTSYELVFAKRPEDIWDLNRLRGFPTRDEAIKTGKYLKEVEKYHFVGVIQRYRRPQD